MRYIVYNATDGPTALLRKTKEKDRPHNYERIATGPTSNIVELARILNEYDAMLTQPPADKTEGSRSVLARE